VRRLLVVEDDPGIRESLIDFFTSREFTVDGVGDAEAAQEHLDTARYAAILLDLKLPRTDGLELLRALRQSGDRTPVLILTARGEEEQRLNGFAEGADDYIVKPFSLRELHARLEAVLRRSGPVATCIGKADIDLDAHEVIKDGVSHRLLGKEVELLAFFLRNVGRVLDRAEILREVWGYEQFPTTRTVDTHVFNLRQKIEETPERPRHLLTVHGVGYRLVR
jgi:DNA-binding response OmpR family regulator